MTLVDTLQKKQKPLNRNWIILKAVNLKLWSIEDDKRKCEKDKNFGEKFIKLSRNVHFLNDERAKIKLEINEATGSKIKEIKEYTNYWKLYFFSKNLIRLCIKKVMNK